MKKLTPYLFLLFLLPACEKNQSELNSYHLARIVGFDMNCSTCILKFVDDSLKVMREIGKSPENSYESVNLNKGDYQTGQLLRVKIRNPNTDELNPCIALYPTPGYKGIFVTDFTDFENLVLNDTVYLSFNDCLNENINQFYFCFDSVINESRCPTGVECFWEGNARVRFKFEPYGQNPVLFELNTSSTFTNDTIINGYKFTLIDLQPYPVYGTQTEQKDYKAQILIGKK